MPTHARATAASHFYWYPKMFGRMLDERLGRIHFWLTLVAFNAVFLPLFAVGLGGHMRRIYNPMQYDFLQPLQPIHRFVTFAAIVLLLGQLPLFSLSLMLRRPNWSAGPRRVEYAGIGLRP